MTKAKPGSNYITKQNTQKNVFLCLFDSSIYAREKITKIGFLKKIET